MLAKTPQGYGGGAGVSWHDFPAGIPAALSGLHSSQEQHIVLMQQICNR